MHDVLGYAELALREPRGGRGESASTRRDVDVPTGFLLCPDDNTIPAPDHLLGSVFSKIAQRNVAAKGGHFLAFEQPELFVAELQEFFAAFR
jgi:pimeloyl-ACP methyl ester carboxylesterase